MYYIITAHGKYAEGCKSSCEMITGDTSAFVPVTFTEEMTKEELLKEKEGLEAEYKKFQQRGLKLDMSRGKPSQEQLDLSMGMMDVLTSGVDLTCDDGTDCRNYNAAMRIVSEHKNIQLVAGLSQQLLVLINSGEELADAIEQVGEIYGNTKVAKENKTVQAPKEPVEKNGIVNFRLDERLIHGQVATFWTRTLQADRIIVADDDVLKDEIGVSALKAAVPSGVHLSILSVDNAAARLNAGIYSGQRVFLIVNKTKTIRRMVESGLKVKEVNIGNMGEKEGRQRIKKSVYCTSEELADVEAVEKAGVTVFAQMVPNDEKKTFRSYLH